MANINLIEAFQELKETEQIDRPTLMNILKEVFESLLYQHYFPQKKKKKKADEVTEEVNVFFTITVNPERGDLEIIKKQTIVENEEDVKNKNFQISLAEAQKEDPDYEVGEIIYEDIDISKIFGRRQAITSAKGTLIGKLRDFKKAIILDKYKKRMHQIITAEVQHIGRDKILLIDDEHNDLTLPKEEQIRGDFFKKGDIVKALVIGARIEKNNTVTINVSRKDHIFLQKLLEIEVPEILDGLIVIKKTVRVAGERSKIAVESLDDRIDPVGACVGTKGNRIHSIVRELNNENIDIINFTNNPQLLIQRALHPVSISSIDLNSEEKKADVYVKPEDISKVIGKRGVNIKLAQDLTGFLINVYRDEEEIENIVDINIDEFDDEIESWVIAIFKENGFDTARSILAVPNEDIERRTDLEMETIEDVKKILVQELETDDEE